MVYFIEPEKGQRRWGREPALPLRSKNMEKTDYRRKLRGNTMTTSEYGGVVLGRENDVVRSGYRSAQDQIYELMRSGQRLQQAREERYAQPTGLSPRHYGEIDVTVAVEKVAYLKRQGEEKAAEKQAAKEAKAAEEAAKAETTKETPKPAAEGGGVT